MLPEVDQSVEALLEDIDVVEEVSRTYKMHLEQKRIQGITDGMEAMHQAIFKLLNTEKNEYLLYSEEYGIELQDLYGKDVLYVIPELERRIKEALLEDDRIEDVTGFAFSYKKGVVNTYFEVNTIFGDVNESMEVKI